MTHLMYASDLHPLHGRYCDFMQNEAPARALSTPFNGNFTRTQIETRSKKNSDGYYFEWISFLRY